MKWTKLELFVVIVLQLVFLYLLLFYKGSPSSGTLTSLFFAFDLSVCVNIALWHSLRHAETAMKDVRKDLKALASSLKKGETRNG